MASVADLIAHHARLGLTLLAGPAQARPVQDVTAVESLRAVGNARPNSVAVVIQAASVGALSYELDVAIRTAADHELAALILVGRSQIPGTAASLAARGAVAVLSCPLQTDIADLVLQVGRTLRGGEATTLNTAQHVLEEIPELEAAGSIPDLLQQVGALLGCELDYAPQSPERAHGPGTVVLRGIPTGTVEVRNTTEATRLVLPAVVASVARLLDHDLSRRFAPAQSRAEAIAEILVCDRDRLPALADTAWQLGLALEQMHVAICVNLRPVTTEDDTSRQRRHIDHAELIALQTLPPRNAQWHVVRSGSNLLAIRSQHSAPNDIGQQMLADAQDLVAELGSTVQSAIFAGVGTIQHGVEGLRQTAAEARGAASATEAAGRAGVVGVFDATGLHRLLIELSFSPLSRQLMNDVLAPLDRLGGTRAHRAVETLAAYLDAQCSPTRAAETLRLHPNAVAYRIKNITTTLDTDLTRPDSRLILHLACRNRLANGR